MSTYLNPVDALLPLLDLITKNISQECDVITKLISPDSVG
jgi:hypothetical protein